MTLYDFLKKEADEAKPKIFAAALLSGAANSAVLALSTAGKLRVSELRVDIWVLFALVCAVYVFTYAYCVKTITNIIESTLYKTRIRLAEKIRQAELVHLDRIGVGKIYDKITQQAAIISNASWSIALGLQAMTLVVFVLIYMAYLSLWFFIAIVLLCLIVRPFYQRYSQVATDWRQEAAETQGSLFEILADFLRGFKEIRLRSQRGSDLYLDFEANAYEVKESTIKAHVADQELFSVINLVVYVLLAVVVFVLPQLIDMSSDLVGSLVSAVVFLFGPIGILSSASTEYERAEMAVEGILKLEGQLEQAAAPESPDFFPSSAPFQLIEALDLSFVYQPLKGGPSFSLGPLSLTLHSGEIVFFVGGNGSGKTTLLKLLSGLYSPSSGSLRLDGVPLGPHNRQSYRERIAAIFTDFHLFKKLYGLPEPEAQHVQSLLEQMQLQSQVAYTDEGFSRLELSTGQRKRLAMLVALLEDRPLYIFDEWAADQDPEFRKYYYEELLPELKRRGKTVWAISHDDRYFHCADRVVTLEYGSIRSIVTVPPPSAIPAQPT